MLHVHEIHKVVNDLIQDQAYQLAFEICERYRHRFDDGYLTFHFLTLPAKMGDLEKTIALLSDALNTNTWISLWAMELFNLFPDFRDEPAFRALMVRIHDAEQVYWASELARPVTHRPRPRADLPYPMLIGLHGNGLNATHSAEKWSAAEVLGWLTTHPQARHIIGFHQHWWSDMTESRQTVLDHVTQIRERYQIDTGRIILGGFSSGGQVALELALGGQLDAKGFILVGAGGQYFEKPDTYWQKRVQQAPKNLRGVMFYSDYDMERSGAHVEKLLNLFERYDVDVKFFNMRLAGHGFPEPFTDDLTQAINYIISN